MVLLAALYTEKMSYVEAKKYLRPDGIWSAYGSKNRQQFIENTVPKLHLRANVHPDILAEFEIINYLLVHSYYKYQFFDVAYNKALQVMEMAFKLKYIEIEGKPWNAKAQKNLIDYLNKRNYFELDAQYLHKMREIRNHTLHPEHHSFSGNMFVKQLHHIVEIINELYDDIPLRIKRKTLQEAFIDFVLMNLKTEVELIIGGRHIPLHDLQILLVDNKQATPIYNIIAVPLFPLKPYKEYTGKGIRVPETKLLMVLNISYENSEITGFDVLSNSEIRFCKISNIKTLARVKQWKLDYEALHPYHKRDTWQFDAGLLYFELLSRFTLKEYPLTRYSEKESH